MQPLEQLLDRIRWDAGFGRGAFAIGYYDRMLDRECVIPLASMAMDPGTPGAFNFEDDRGVVHTVPLHRVRVVYRDGAEIWRRPAR